MLWYCYINRPDRKVRGRYISETKVLDVPGSERSDSRAVTAKAAAAFRSSMNRTLCLPVPEGYDFGEQARAQEMLAKQTKARRTR